LQTTIDKKGRGSPSLKLHAFIVSNTPYGDLNWTDEQGRKLSQDVIASMGIVFQMNNQTTNIETLMQATRSGT
jgi:hypothetical protein